MKKFFFYIDKQIFCILKHCVCLCVEKISRLISICALLIPKKLNTYSNFMHQNIL